MNPVVHFEMPAVDIKRMMEFYSRVFGWQTNMLGSEMGEYVVVTTTKTDEKSGRPLIPGTINGGFYQKEEESGNECPSVVIAVDNIKDYLEKIKQAGGEVLKDAEQIPGVGLYASFKDTEGNRVTLLEPLDQMADFNSR